MAQHKKKKTENLIKRSLTSTLKKNTHHKNNQNQQVPQIPWTIDDSNRLKK